MSKTIIVLALLLAACKPTYNEIVEACAKAQGSVIRVYNDKHTDYQCVKLEVVR